MATVIPSYLYQEGNCMRTALVALNNTTAGDTVDLSASFQNVKRAGIVSATGTTIAAISTIGTGTNGGPTLLTVPAGPSNDGVWLLVVGVAAQP